MTEPKSNTSMKTKAAASTPKAKPAVEPEVAKKAAAKKAPAKKAPAKKATASTSAASADKVTLAMILETVPHLAGGEWLHLGDAAKALHDRKLLGKNASTTKLFNKYPEHFELTPKKQPNRVRFVGNVGAS